MAKELVKHALKIPTVALESLPNSTLQSVQLWNENNVLISYSNTSSVRLFTVSPKEMVENFYASALPVPLHTAQMYPFLVSIHATGENETVLRTFDVEKRNQCLQKLAMPASTVKALFVTEKGVFVLTDKEVRAYPKLYDLKKEDCTPLRDPLPLIPSSASFARLNLAVLVASNQIVMLDLFTASIYMPLRKFGHPITSIDFSDRRLAAIAGDTLHVVDFYSDSESTIPCDIPASVARFYEREKLVVGDVGGRLFAWDFQRNAKLYQINPYDAEPTSYQISDSILKLHVEKDTVVMFQAFGVTALKAKAMEFELISTYPYDDLKITQYAVFGNIVVLATSDTFFQWNIELAQKKAFKKPQFIKRKNPVRQSVVRSRTFRENSISGSPGMISPSSSSSNLNGPFVPPPTPSPDTARRHTADQSGKRGLSDAVKSSESFFGIGATPRIHQSRSKKDKDEKKDESPKVAEKEKKDKDKKDKENKKDKKDKESKKSKEKASALVSPREQNTVLPTLAPRDLLINAIEDFGRSLSVQLAALNIDVIVQRGTRTVSHRKDRSNVSTPLIETSEELNSDDASESQDSVGKLPVPSSKNSRRLSAKRSGDLRRHSDVSRQTHVKQTSDPSSLASELGIARRKIESLQGEVAAQTALLNQQQSEASQYRAELEIMRARLASLGISTEVDHSEVDHSTADVSQSETLTPDPNPRVNPAAENGINLNEVLSIATTPDLLALSSPRDNESSFPEPSNEFNGKKGKKGKKADKKPRKNEEER